jgi:hypothetical protein
MEKIDLVGLGEAVKEFKEPIMKFLDMVEKFFGRTTRHIFDKKDIDNEVYKATKFAELEVNKQRSLLALKAEEINLLSSAINQNPQQNISYEDGKLKIASLEKDKLVIGQKLGETTVNLTTNNIENRAIDRLLTQQIRKQDNIEKVLQIAYNETANEQEVSGEPVNDDWLNRFFNYAEDVSNEDMQTIWGKILAGEIKQPNSYSIRVLELLKNITKSEADIFVKISQFVVSGANREFIFKFPTDTMVNLGITFEDILLLTEIGILSPSDNIALTLYNENADIIIIYNNLGIRWNYFEMIAIQSLTNVACQLLKLVTIEPKPNMNYLKELNKEYPSINLEYAPILENNDTGIECGEWKSFNDLE